MRLTAATSVGDETLNRDRVWLIRSCGRSAGRRHKMPVKTFDMESDGGPDGPHVALVVNMTPLDPDDELGQLRRQRRLRAAINGLSIPPHETTH